MLTALASSAALPLAVNLAGLAAQVLSLHALGPTARLSTVADAVATVQELKYAQAKSFFRQPFQKFAPIAASEMAGSESDLPALHLRLPMRLVRECRASASAGLWHPLLAEASAISWATVTALAASRTCGR